MRIASVFIISLMILSSCSHKDEAIELSRDFFASLSDSTYGKPNDFYPDYDSLGIEAKSDIVDIEASDVTEKNDTFTVRCYNNYTNSEGTFMQDCSLQGTRISSTTSMIRRDSLLLTRNWRGSERSLVPLARSRPMTRH